VAFSLRKGCVNCGRELLTFKEKVSRHCSDCSAAALDSFDKMAQGKVKEGFTELIKTKGLSKDEADKIQETTKKALGKKRKKLEKALRKKGLSESEIKEGLERFERLGI